MIVAMGASSPASDVVSAKYLDVKICATWPEMMVTTPGLGYRAGGPKSPLALPGEDGQTARAEQPKVPAWRHRSTLGSGSCRLDAGRFTSAGLCGRRHTAVDRLQSR